VTSIIPGDCDPGWLCNRERRQRSCDVDRIPPPARPVTASR